jgi:septal ring factor EnvC (AmiA/AmiB activator)
MKNRMTERVSDLGDRARDRITESRLDKFDRENDRLKHEVRMLREDLREERGSLERALDALKRDEHVTVHTKAPKRRGRLLRTIVIGGGAYVLGTRAGRERYDQIVEKVRGLSASARNRATGEPRSWESSSPAGATDIASASDPVTGA